jgi:hypothetical protein
VSSTAVVVAFDPQECVVLDIGEVVPGLGVNELLFVGREERFGDGVVEAGCTAAHGAAHAVESAEVGEFLGGVLAAAVTVENDSRWGFSGDECGGEGLDDQTGPHMVGYSVSDYFTGMQVDYGSGVDLSVDLDISDIATPASIGLFGGEILSDQIRRIDGPRACGGRLLPGPGVASLQTGGLHQPPDPLGRDSVAEHDQLGVDSADAGIPGEFFVDFLDGLGEFGIGALAFARPCGTPPVVTLAGYAELLAYERPSLSTVSLRPSPRSPRISRLLFREPGRYFFREITLHSQGGVLLAEPLQLGPFGLGQLLVRARLPLFGFAHPFI